MSDFAHVRDAFVNARHLRESGGDHCLCDPDFEPHCGYMSAQEVGLLYLIAAEKSGLWCEIGTHTGWSAAHLAAAGNQVIAVDPAFIKRAQRVRCEENWGRAGVIDRIQFSGMTSQAFFETYGGGVFTGVLIDGDHTSPQPLNDAMRAFQWLDPDGVIVLHDYRGDPIKEAVDWLVFKGMKVKSWETMNGMAACWFPSSNRVMP